MIWRVLGIEETKDKKAITRAYRDRLGSVNPEEKPEEFKELRAAYEAALKKADEEDTPAEEKSELDQWVEELESIYNNFPARIDVDAWKELLSRDICQGLDTRPQVEEALLVFLMDHFRITQKVMLYLEEEFAFTGHLDELYEKYPRDFIEFIIIDSIRYGESLPQEMFYPGFDAAACDIYAELYSQARRVNIEEAGEIYQKMKDSPESHPYGEALLLKAALYQENDPSVLQKLKALCEEWPEDEHLAVDLALAYRKTGDIEAMRAVCREILEKNPEQFTVRQYMAEAKAEEGNYKEAIEQLNMLIQDAEGDARVVYELSELRKNWNQAYSETLEARLQKNPEDHTSRWELIWCHIENNQTEPAFALAEMLPEGQPDPFGYYNLMSVLAECKNDNEASLRNLKKLLEVIRQMEPDGTEKTRRRLERTAEVLGRMAGNLMELRRFEEAEEMVDQALAEKPEDMNNLLHMIQVSLCIRKYEKAEALADLYIRKGPRNAIGYYLKASACFRRGNDSQAFQLVNTALDLDGSDLQSYLLKLRILMRNHAYEPADALIRFLEDNGITEDPTVAFCKIQKYMQVKKENIAGELEEYLQLAKSVDEQLDTGDYGKPFWAPEFYYNYADMTYELQKLKDAFSPDVLTAILDKGIAMDPDDFECRSYKGWLLKRAGRTDEALEIYKELETWKGHSLFVESQLAELYYRNLELHADKALQYYEILIREEQENPDHHFYAGMCCMKMNRLDEAREHFLKEQEMAPEDIDGYYRLVTVLHKMNRLEEALEQAEKTVEMAKKREEKDTVRFFMPLIQILRRLGRPDQANQAVLECARCNPDWSMAADREIFKTYVRFGRYKEAELLLERLKKGGKKEEKDLFVVLQASLFLFLGNTKKCFTHLLNHRRNMSSVMVRDMDQMIALYKGNFGKNLQIMEACYLDKLDRGELGHSDRCGYAFALFLAGAKAEAREVAKDAIAVLDQEIPLWKSDRLIQQTKRAYLLGFTGQVDEAREELLKLRGEPMCEHCDYCYCKDIDLYLSYLELIDGNYEKALQMAMEGRRNCPDEEDFVEVQFIAEHLLNKS